MIKIFNRIPILKDLAEKNPGLFQLVRYGIVGVVSNLAGYLVYLLLTIWLEPKLVVSIFFPIAVAIAYPGHAKYSFSQQGNHTGVIVRYFTAYFAGYCLNLVMLYVLHDQLHYPHQLVQFTAVFAVACLLFLLLKYFVFTNSKYDKKNARR